MPAVRESEMGVGVAINPMTPALRDNLFRLLALLDTLADIPVLGPMIERELLYRLLQGPKGSSCARSLSQTAPWSGSGAL